MKISKTNLPGVLLYQPTVYKDLRGGFLETYNKDYGIKFVQSNISYSELGTLRGLHAQRVHPQGKLLTVLLGSIYDVAVDIKTGKWQGFNIYEYEQIYIPPGYYHGFFVTSEQAKIEYKCTDYYYPDDEIGVIWNDPILNIKWPAPFPRLSKKDSKLPTFKRQS
jgi:dTDP-4-dehydrorhamnose 3,5-epimerase